MIKYIGFIIVGTLAFYLLSVPAPLVLIVPTFLAWLVPLLMWRTLGENAIRQTFLLLLIGFTLISYSISQGVPLDWKQILAGNLPLLAMFVAVAFLSLTPIFAPTLSDKTI